MGPFVNASRNGIRAERMSALLGLLQLAASHPGGIFASLGYNNRTTWINDNLDGFFIHGGPLASFRLVVSDVLQRHLRAA